MISEDDGKSPAIGLYGYGSFPGASQDKLVPLALFELPKFTDPISIGLSVADQRDGLSYPGYFFDVEQRAVLITICPTRGDMVHPFQVYLPLNRVLGLVRLDSWTPKDFAYVPWRSWGPRHALPLPGPVYATGIGIAYGSRVIQVSNTISLVHIQRDPPVHSPERSSQSPGGGVANLVLPTDAILPVIDPPLWVHKPVFASIQCQRELPVPDELSSTNISMMDDENIVLYQEVVRPFENALHRQTLISSKGANYEFGDIDNVTAVVIAYLTWHCNEVWNKN